MPMLDMFMLGFLVVFAVVSIVWFIYVARSEDEK